MKFSLRTLFVLIALISIPLGWMACQLNWIRKRHDFLDSTRFDNTEAYVSQRPRPSAPGGLWLFGEKGVGFVCLENPAYKSEAKQLFPEAEIEISMYHR